MSETRNKVETAVPGGLAARQKQTRPPGTADSTAQGPATRWRRSHRSVFTKLVVIMVTLAAVLLLLVSGLFWLVLGPSVHGSFDQVLEDYTTRLAATSLDFATAQRLRQQLNLQTRYAGPAGNWTTNEALPTIDAARLQQARMGERPSGFPRFHYHLVAAPDGGAYLFTWGPRRGLSELHSLAITMVLVTIVLVVVVAYLALKWLLAPLRRLNEAVNRLSAGELDVALASATGDEFGRLTEAFNRMVGRVRGMIDAREQLLLDVSHELRSPLTRLRVALELLPENKQRAGMAADVREMERMIAELLELERLRSGSGLQKTRQDLVPLLRAAAEPYRGVAPGVQVFISVPELCVDIDAEKMRTVIRNLIENAVKYSRPDSRPVEVLAMQQDERVIVRVTDDGPGIPVTEAERVFEPFYRVDRSRSKNTGGYGLGLSICKRVMLAHGGDITLERDRRAGASFVLTFPGPTRPSA
ncbi:sensor histidine kinase [Opitutus terrae]|uniref:Signal transduction histidine-protein kinase/phosphatase MprB n=1 Tax=Opitutus terrae (strain DSM 11246 / JCM 15787 / PB90-1) TaxID=452637 RepID=B1ZQC7_OPITP|nr:HAMP domain-containing sensor histidine kinase [Opitutus terrae]ACB73607.1 integral membrane sensor signal transduction histidine kinase [Opitutus terrae PB90-1]